MEAIQAAIRQSAPGDASATASMEVSSMSLYATDREAQAARPRLADLSVRWAGRLARSFRSFLSDVGVDAMGAELVDAPSVAEELRGMWRAVRIVEGRGTILVAFGGGLIEAAAARRCGARQSGASQRDPSRVSLRLFTPTGDIAMQAFEESWSEIDRAPLRRDRVDQESIDAALGKDSVLVATIAISGETSGRIRIFARPEVLATPEPETPTVPADPETIAAALGAVPVDVKVVLGAFSLRLSQLRDLAPGAEFSLPVFVDQALPIYCGGVLKAWGRPVVSRGVIAVEVCALATPGGDHP